LGLGFNYSLLSVGVAVLGTFSSFLDFVSQCELAFEFLVVPRCIQRRIVGVAVVSLHLVFSLPFCLGSRKESCVRYLFKLRLWYGTSIRGRPV